MSRIGDLGKVVTGKTPPTADSENYGGELPFITPSDMKGQKYIKRTERTISAKGRAHVKNLVIPPRAVFVSCIGSDMGKVGMTRVESVTNQQINSIIMREGVYPDYIYYNLISRKDELQRLATSGSAQPILNKGHFSQLKVPLPPVSEQEAIANILGTLDDKIELNRRMNETLEAMARAAFKSWFVDFDQIPGHSPHREWQESPLGRIPKGWSTMPLPEAIEVNPPRTLGKGTIAPYLAMANMPTRSARAIEVYEREFGSGMRFIDGDTLVARITPCLENGKTCFVDFLGSGKVAWGSTEYIVLRPKSPLPPEFAYFLSRTEDFRSFAISNMTGSSGRQRVPADALNLFFITIPPAEIANKFGLFARALMDKMKSNDEQARTLAAIRDALLPKMLSGEIRIKDAEFIEGRS